MHDFKCQRCGECCKRYFIISLPHELENQARARNMKMREFLDRHCQLFLQIFPYAKEDDAAPDPANGNAMITADEKKLVIGSSLLPKNIAQSLEREIGFLPQHMVVLPMISFHRAQDGACTFYTQENGLGGCTIYGARPMECRMFPFISLKKNADYSKLYPFCGGLRFKDEKLNYSDLSYVHFRQVADYLERVRQQGFSAIWKEWPMNGVLLYKERPLGGITEMEFFRAIAPYK